MKKKYLKKKNKHINKAGNELKDAMLEYMADFILNFFNLFRLWKQKGSKLDLNMMRYIHSNDWDAKL